MLIKVSRLIGVAVNKAGYSLVGPFEGSSMDETNLFETVKELYRLLLILYRTLGRTRFHFFTLLSNSWVLLL
jgi:hypothetical protein